MGVVASGVMEEHTAEYWTTEAKLPLQEGSGKWTSLLNWCNSRMVGFQVRNLEEDWRNGCAFLALYNGAAPGELDLWVVDTSDAAANINRGLTLFEVRLGIPKLIDTATVLRARPVELKKALFPWLADVRKNYPALGETVPPSGQSSAEEPVTIPAGEECLGCGEEIRYPWRECRSGSISEASWYQQQMAIKQAKKAKENAHWEQPVHTLQNGAALRAVEKMQEREWFQQLLTPSQSILSKLHAPQQTSAPQPVAADSGHSAHAAVPTVPAKAASKGVAAAVLAALAPDRLPKQPANPPQPKAASPSPPTAAPPPKAAAPNRIMAAISKKLVKQPPSRALLQKQTRLRRLYEQCAVAYTLNWNTNSKLQQALHTRPNMELAAAAAAARARRDRMPMAAVSHSTGGVLEEMNEQEIGDVIKAKEKELQIYKDETERMLRAVQTDPVYSDDKVNTLGWHNSLSKSRSPSPERGSHASSLLDVLAASRSQNPADGSSWFRGDQPHNSTTHDAKWFRGNEPSDDNSTTHDAKWFRGNASRETAEVAVAVQVPAVRWPQDLQPVAAVSMEAAVWDPSAEFDKLDVNKDGVISKDEWMSHYAAMSKQPTHTAAPKSPEAAPQTPEVSAVGTLGQVDKNTEARLMKLQLDSNVSQDTKDAIKAALLEKQMRSKVSPKMQDVIRKRLEHTLGLK